MTGELGEIDVLARRERVKYGGSGIGGASIPGQSSLSGSGSESPDGTTSCSSSTVPIDPAVWSDDE
ncbi:hypothetical protein HYG81_18135 [Natrinema zhouii]|uniref:Uncharacterized protein n=1 Tax=Natrinema zhouii TaxID=1710539 RepID=A0A7D6CR54_9EURY|nr:hypothetical protein [Natrinema zhouii]QLK25970.1 hypothetical protein HYG81_18135 [Natrinema zhouii]